MDKYIYDESNGLLYELQGDYYIPCLTVPAEEARPIGLWGQQHKRYLKEYRPALYNSLLLGGKLSSHLADMDEQVEERMLMLTKQMAEREGATEHLEAEDQML